MAYSNFKLKEVERLFDLNEIVSSIFQEISIEPSSWLKETLLKSSHLYPKSEKARSELLITPILLELLDRNNYEFSLFSGESLDVDVSKGLNGECDFILSKGKKSYSIQTPIFGLVEAKQNIVENSLGQCVAQLIGAQIYNESENKKINAIYGCVTNGLEWQFIKLKDKNLYIHEKIYYFNEIELVLGVLQQIVSEFL